MGTFMTGKLTALAFTGALFGFGLAHAEPVKVGMITTLSGGGSSLGIDVRDGFKLALKLHGEGKVDLIVEDDQRKPDVAVQLADKMIQRDKVKVLTGLIFSNLAMAVVPSTVRQGVFYISPNAGPSALAGKGCHRFYFNVAWQNDNLHEGAGAYATSTGYKKVFILAPNYPAGKDALTGFKRLYKGKLAGEIYTKLGQTDYAAELATIRAAKPDAVFFFLPGGMGVSFIKQYDQAKLGFPLIGPAFSFDQGILKAVGKAALGVKNASQWAPDFKNPANVAFVAAFKKEYGRIPSLYASQGYDAALLLLSALKKADPSDKEAFRAALKKADFASTRGAFKFGPNQHPVQDIFIREVVEKDGGLTNITLRAVLKGHSDAYAKLCKY